MRACVYWIKNFIRNRTHQQIGQNTRLAITTAETETALHSFRIVWMAHKKGGNNFKRYWKKMSLKYAKTLGSVNQRKRHSAAGDAGFKRIRNLQPYLNSVVN